MRKTFLVTAALVAGLLVVSPVESKVLKITLSELLAKTDVVVIAEVLAVRDTGPIVVDERGWEHRETEASLKVLKVVTGKFDSAGLSIDYDRSVSPNPEFAVGRRSLLFLRKGQRGYEVVQNYAGNIAIENEELIGIYLMGEAERQNLGDFLKKISGNDHP